MLSGSDLIVSDNALLEGVYGVDVFNYNNNESGAVSSSVTMTGESAGTAMRAPVPGAFTVVAAGTPACAAGEVPSASGRPAPSAV